MGHRWWVTIIYARILNIFHVLTEIEMYNNLE